MKNFGESHVRFLLKQLAENRKDLNGYVFNNVYLTSADGTGRIFTEEYDHILVTQFGIIVIETKNWTGETYLTQNVGVLSDALSNKSFCWDFDERKKSQKPQKWYLFNMKMHYTSENTASSATISAYAQEESNHLDRLRGKSVHLLKFLRFEQSKLSIVLNRLVFIVNGKNELLIDDGKSSKAFGTFTTVVRSDGLIDDLEKTLQNPNKEKYLTTKELESIKIKLSDCASSYVSFGDKSTKS